MCAITYLLPISGKSIPSIKLHLSKKRQCLRYVDSPYPNTCVLEAIARYQLKDSKEKRYSDKQVLAKMKEIVNLFSYEQDDSSFRYHLAQSFPIEGDNEINLLLIQSEELNVDSHTKENMAKHIDKCRLNKGQIKKQVMLDNIQRPFVPHIMQNKTYRYLLANNRTSEFKPTQYFITYDFETYEQKVNTDFGKDSKLISKLIPLSVASTIYSSK
ncbi:MAG: hypothetical protein EZS28_034520, partial [Streblomastix strix]